VVGANAHIRTRVHLRAALTDQNVPSDNTLATEPLDAQTLGVGIAAVTGAAACLFMCHVLLPESNAAISRR
jgi:hypothetical protein